MISLFESVFQVFCSEKCFNAENSLWFFFRSWNLEVVYMDRLPWPSSSTSSSTSSSPPKAHSLSIGVEVWMMAEQRIQEILSTIQPTPVSEEKRKQVIEHVQRVIRGHYGTEVNILGHIPCMLWWISLSGWGFLLYSGALFSYAIILTVRSSTSTSSFLALVACMSFFFFCQNFF